MPPCQLQNNGQADKNNRSLTGLLKPFVDKCTTREWDRAITGCLLAYKAAVYASIGQKLRIGKRPGEAHIGRPHNSDDEPGSSSMARICRIFRMKRKAVRPVGR